MEINELITIVRNDYLADQLQAYLWDDDFMLRSFTEAQRQACNRTDFLYEELNLSLQSGVQNYPLNPRITRLAAVLFENRPVIKKSIAEIERGNPLWRGVYGMSNSVCHYLIRGNRIFFAPAPALTDSGLIVTLECYVQPKDSFTSMSDTPVIPEEFHRDLVLWVLYEALSKRDMDTFSIQAKDYLEKFNSVFGHYVPAPVRQHQFENGLSPVVRFPNYNHR